MFPRRHKEPSIRTHCPRCSRKSGPFGNGQGSVYVKHLDVCVWGRALGGQLQGRQLRPIIPSFPLL